MGASERSLKPFLCHYHWDDSRWGVQIHAYDQADAEARCKALGRLRLDGELVAAVPLPLPTSASPWLVVVLRSVGRFLTGR